MILYRVSREEYYSIVRTFYTNHAKGLLEAKRLGNKRLVQRLQNKLDEIELRERSRKL